MCLFIYSGAHAQEYYGYQTIPISSYKDFYNAVYGNWYDVDHIYGAQCWDGASLFWWNVTGTYLRTMPWGSGVAKDCWNYSRDFNAGTNFYLIDDVTQIQKGDVLVFGAGSTGHICFANEDYATGMTSINVLGQNQSPAGQAFDVNPYELGTFLGLFRYVGWADRTAPVFSERRIDVSNIHSKGFTITGKAEDDREIVSVWATAWPTEDTSRRTDFSASYDTTTHSIIAHINIEQIGYLGSGYAFTLYAKDKSGNIGSLTSITGISPYEINVSENGTYKATTNAQVYTAPYDSFNGISTRAYVLEKNDQRNVIGSYEENGIKWYRLESYVADQWVHADEMTRISVWDLLWNSITSALTGNQTNVYIVDESTYYSSTEADSIIVPGTYSYSLENYNLGDPTASDPDSVTIDETNFPDSAFRNYIINNYDLDNDGILSPEELKAVSEIVITKTTSVRSLAGIENFKNLELLDCSNQAINSLDLTSNTSLLTLKCSGNSHMNSLNLTANSKLKRLECNSIGLSQLILTNNPDIEVIECSKQGAASIVLGVCPKLKTLNCSGNGLTSLDISGCTALETLNCSNNSLTTLNISSCVALKTLYCGANAFTSFAPSNNSLTYLDCMSCPQLSHLNVNGCPMLEELWCRFCVLTEINVDNCSQLNEFWCCQNLLTSLDISKNTNLGHLYCVGNQLDNLDVTHNPYLWGLSCGLNKLTDLDLSQNPLLRDLSCYGNHISYLDLSHNPILEGLRTYDNCLTSLDLSSNDKLGYVWADNNGIEIGSYIDLNVLPGFDVSRVSNVTGGLLVSHYIFLTEDTAHYDYQCNDQYSVNFFLTGEVASIIDSGVCGSNISWVLYSNGLLALIGEGEMSDFSLYTTNPQNSAPWYKHQDKIKLVYIEDGITNVSNNAFWGCTLIESVSLPDSITRIGSRSFASCNTLKVVNIPANVNYIGEFAFILCNSLIEVKIPSSVTFIGEGAFQGSGVKTVVLNAQITLIPSSLFSGCNNLENVSIPSGVTTIGSSAFWVCQNLKHITIPESVISIGDQAFGSCRSIEEIVIPEKVTTIGRAAFSYCTNLQNVNLPSGISVISPSTFSGCESLETVTIPAGVTEIGSGAFSQCSSLNNIEIPQNVVTIGEGAFYNSGLTSITIPAKVESIGTTAFSTDTLTEYHVQSDNKFYSDEGNALYNKDKTILIAIPKGWTSFVIPEGVTEIGPWACYGCKLETVKMPNSLTTIGAYAFNGCWRVEHYVIPRNVTTIGTAAFWWCEMTSVTIPKSVTTISGCAFDDCLSLKDVYYTGNEEEWASINIGNSNSHLLSATIHYNSIPVIADLILPSSLTTIETDAFIGIPYSTVIYIPETVIHIDENAFNPDAIIITPAGSFAAIWADSNNIEYYEQKR